MILTRLRRQDGSALVTAMLVMMVCLMAGLTAMKLVDSGSNGSRIERTNESAFSLAEGVLNSQIFLLSKQWPANSGTGFAYPSSCTQASNNSLCPDPPTLVGNFTGADYQAGIQWSTEVHDNTATDVNGTTYDATQFYDDATVRQQPTWDANKDGLMWVRAQALIHGERRTLIALVKAEKLDTPFPRNAIVANRLNVGPNGNQTYVYTGSSYVTLRCGNGAGGQLDTSQCEGWQREVNVGPSAVVNVDPAARPGLTPETVDRLRAYAVANSSWYQNCPDASKLTGDVVFIETANCTYTGNSEWNTSAKPGVLIIGSGSIELQGNTTYHGVIYNVNGSDGHGTASTGYVVTLQGNGCVDGSVVIDGAGGLQIGASNGASKCNGNLGFAANAANNLVAYGTAGIVQNSFREIPAHD